MTAGSFRTPPSRHRQSPCHGHRQTLLPGHRHHTTACGLSHIQLLPYRQPSSSATRIVLLPYPVILDTCPKTVSTETCLGDDGVDDQRIAPGIGDPIRVILSVERDRALGPFEVRGCGRADYVDFSEFALPLTRSEASRSSPKDQKAVLDLGDRCPWEALRHSPW